MKKYILMAIFSVCSCGLLIYFYSQGENQLAKTNEKLLNSVLTAKRLDAAIEKDLLQSRSFLSLTYDSMVANGADEEGACTAFKGPDLSIYGKLDKSLDALIDRFCEETEKKLHHIETFKSKNAVLRNSIYFVHQESLPPEISGLRRRLIDACLSFTTVSSAEARTKLSAVIEEAEVLERSQALNAQLSNLLLHSKKILSLKQDLDELTAQVITAPTSKILDEMREIYFRIDKEANRTASTFRQIVLGICFSFFFFTVFSILSLWKSANALSEANATLEDRVSERTKQLEESQAKILEQQQILIGASKMSALGEMAGGVAHEINTPLAVISMRVEQMEECLGDGDFDSLDFMDGLGVVKKTVDRIAKIVNGLRFFAREGRRAESQKVKLSLLVNETLGLCQERFASHGVQLQLPAVLNSEVECRSVEISQVLLNLLNNSFDAIADKSEKWIKLDVMEGRDHIELSVTDCGLGIPKDIQDKLMQPFFTTKEIGKGTGLGLSLSKGIVEGHYGKLYIDKACANTRFVVWLPKYQPVIAADQRAA